MCGFCEFSTAETIIMITAATDYSSYIHPPVDLPSFPALESLQISSYDVGLTRCLMSVLSSITSAPALASIEIRYLGCFNYEPHRDIWNNMDIWLAKVAKQSKVEHGPLVTPTEWLFRESLWEELLQRFREVGGRIKPCSILQVHRYR